MTPVLKTHPITAELRGRNSVRAVVSVFSNVDAQGDRVMPGAFRRSLAAWKASGDPIPFLWSHQWQDPMAHIGVVRDAYETDNGLEIWAEVDDSTPFAKQVLKLLRERRVTEFSFAYNIPPSGERRGKDGANELHQLEIIEVGPTLRGANSATELLDVKSVQAILKAEDQLPARWPGGKRCRNGHPLPEPRTLLTGTHPAAECKTCGRVSVWAPSDVSDSEVRREIALIKAAQTHAERPNSEIKRFNRVLDRLESSMKVVHTRPRVAAARAPEREIEEFREVLAALEIR